MPTSPLDYAKSVLAESDDPNTSLRDSLEHIDFTIGAVLYPGDPLALTLTMKKAELLQTPDQATLSAQELAEHANDVALRLNQAIPAWHIASEDHLVIGSRLADTNRYADDESLQEVATYYIDQSHECSQTAKSYITAINKMTVPWNKALRRAGAEDDLNAVIEEAASFGTLQYLTAENRTNFHIAMLDFADTHCDSFRTRENIPYLRCAAINIIESAPEGSAVQEQGIELLADTILAGETLGLSELQEWKHIYEPPRSEGLSDGTTSETLRTFAALQLQRLGAWPVSDHCASLDQISRPDKKPSGSEP